MPERSAVQHQVPPRLTEVRTVGAFTFTAEIDGPSRSVVKLTVTGPKITAAALRLVNLNGMASNAWVRSMAATVVVRLVDADSDYRIPDKHVKGSRSWWRSFAELWLWADISTGKPNLMLAEANGVSRSTVRSWVAAARARDLLPPSGRPGILSDAVRVPR